MKTESIEAGSVESILAQFNVPDRLDRYFELLMDENQRINLVSRETKRADFDRLCAESLLPFVAEPALKGTYLDIGTGGGFPAIPILMIGEFESVLLAERTGKKAAALRRILSGLELKSQVSGTDFPSREINGPFDLITLRWVKLTPDLLKSIRSSLSPGGRFVYYSTPDFRVRGATVYQFEFQENSAVKSFTII